MLLLLLLSFWTTCNLCSYCFKRRKEREKDVVAEGIMARLKEHKLWQACTKGHLEIVKELARDLSVDVNWVSRLSKS